jgi:hypothetical protein
MKRVTDARSEAMAMGRKSRVLGNRSRLRSLHLEFWVSAEQRKAGQVRNLENALILVR